jgi:aryl carrier-like protein
MSSFQDINGLYSIGNDLTTPSGLPILPPINQAALASAQYTLNRQNDVQNILNDENTRLAQKQALVKQAVDGQIRMLTLNDSYRQRNAQYQNIILLAVITLALFILIIKLRSFIPAIPEFVPTILSILLIAGAILWALSIYYTKIHNRDKMYYDRLRLEHPVIYDNSANKVQGKQSAANQGDLFGSLGSFCIGSQCCSTGTYWSDISMSCIPGTAPAPVAQ